MAQITLPVSNGLSLRDIAIRVAEMQEQGASFREALDAAKPYYKGKRQECKKFSPHIDPRNPQYVGTICKSGFNGQLLCGEKCIGCDALLADFVPSITRRPGGFTLRVLPPETTVPNQAR